MKKIAFILALVMVFAVCLVACDETPAENSAPATESSAPAEESKVDEKSEEPEAPEASEEPSEAPEEPSEDPLPPAAEVGELVSVGKTYTATEQFRQGGADVGWGWDENAPIAYPDEENVSLTDGVKEPTEADEYSAAIWAGYSYLVPSYAGAHTFVIDLGEVMSLAQVSVWYGTEVLSNGIGCKNSTITVRISEDGENWTDVGSVSTGSEDELTLKVKEFAVNFSGNGRYVEISVARDGWAFLSELEVYAAK